MTADTEKAITFKFPDLPSPDSDIGAYIDAYDLTLARIKQFTSELETHAKEHIDQMTTQAEKDLSPSHMKAFCNHLVFSV